MPNIVTSTGLAVRIPSTTKLPDNEQWCNRFEIHSATSNRVYIVAQNKQSGGWGCSCPGFKIHRICKHLKNGLGLPDNQIHGREAMKIKKQEQLG